MVKLFMCKDVLDVGLTFGGVRENASNWAHYCSQPWNMQQQSGWYWEVFAMFLGLRKLLDSCTEGTSTCPPTTQHLGCHVHFYQAYPQISTASNKYWGKKAWVRGYSEPCASK